MASLHLIDFKSKLQSFGALRPEAWEKIVLLCQRATLHAGDSFLRKEGSLAYVAEGILKEYNPQHRKKPAIINFIMAEQCLITRKHNQVHYLKACIPTLVFYWDLPPLNLLNQEFEELKKIYDYLCREYDDSIALRGFLLELTVQDRITYFQNHYTAIIPYLKKKDVAHYLHISYNHLLYNW
ncbi:MAG: hypothetical protein EOO88_34065 [Pedobacter sp.]|nr:MAG: hypothetical protein EOO88_34065 [Pedobacter sp.]